MKKVFIWIEYLPLLNFFISICSLNVIRREMNHKSALPAWVVVVAVTILSTRFNVTRAYLELTYEVCPCITTSYLFCKLRGREGRIAV